MNEQQAAMCFYITSQDILDKLSDADKKKYTDCAFIKAEVNNFGDEVTLYCRLFTSNQTDTTETRTRRIKLKI